MLRRPPRFVLICQHCDWKSEPCLTRTVAELQLRQHWKDTPRCEVVRPTMPSQLGLKLS